MTGTTTVTTTVTTMEPVEPISTHIVMKWILWDALGSWAELFYPIIVENKLVPPTSPERRLTPSSMCMLVVYDYHNHKGIVLWIQPLQVVL